MPLHFRCLCGVILNSPDGSAGRAAECPECGKIIVIPQEAVPLAIEDLEKPVRAPAPPAAPEPSLPPVSALPPAVPEPMPEPSAPTAVEFKLPPMEPNPLGQPDAASDAALGGIPEPMIPELEPASPPPGLVLNDDLPDPDTLGGGAGPAPAEPSWPSPDAKGERTLVIGADDMRAASAPDAVDESEPLEVGPLVSTPEDDDEALVPIEADDGDLVPVEADGSAQPLEVAPEPTSDAARPARRKSSVTGRPSGATRRPSGMLRARQTPATRGSGSVPAVADPGRGKRASSRGPRSKTAAVRDRGQKALQVLGALDSGEVAVVPRRSRGTQEKKGGKKKIIFVLLLLLAGACYAALAFAPLGNVPEKYRGQVEAIRAKLREIGLPVEPSAELDEIGDEADAGSEADEDPSELDEEPAETGEGDADNDT
jgi:hypothetical protein